jgi:hypothetical protein
LIEKMIDIDLKPNRKKLRQFGVIATLAFALLGLILYWKKGIFWMSLGETADTLALVAGAAALIAATLSLLAPGGLRPLYIVLTLVAFPIGYVVSHVILAVLFYGLLTPVGLVFRVIGRDPLHRRFDRDAESYWVPRRQREAKEYYFRQF